MAMGDRIVVMSNAEVQQIGTPADVYYNPANLFVARFIGSPGMNLVAGRYVDGVVELPGDNRYPVPVAWRPVLEQGLSNEQVVVALDGQQAEHMVHVRSDREALRPIGTPFHFDLDPAMVRFFDPQTTAALPRPQAENAQPAHATAGTEVLRG
jgi:multiple sugar transport system ATP-binding protein